MFSARFGAVPPPPQGHQARRDEHTWVLLAPGRSTHPPVPPQGGESTSLRRQLELRQRPAPRGSPAPDPAGAPNPPQQRGHLRAGTGSCRQLTAPFHAPTAQRRKENLFWRNENVFFRLFDGRKRLLVAGWTQICPKNCETKLRVRW